MKVRNKQFTLTGLLDNDSIFVSLLLQPLENISFGTGSVLEHSSLQDHAQLKHHGYNSQNETIPVLENVRAVMGINIPRTLF